MADDKQIIRVEKSTNYSVINNDFLRRNDLSWKAKGIMAYLLTLPDDWTIYINELIKHSTDGRAGFYSGWNELKKEGYITRYPVREKGKIIRWETIVREIPDKPTFSPHAENQQVEKQQVENLYIENQTLLNTNHTKDLNKLNTNLTNNTADPAEAESVPDYVSEFEGLWKLYPKGKKQGKDKAKAVYIRERKKKDGPTYELVQSKLLEYIKQIHIKQTDKQFIKQGGTWFNQHGWADEYDLSPDPTKPSFGSNNHRRVEPLPEWAKPDYRQPEEKPLDPEEQARLLRKLNEL